jgi:hypothetical protein
LAAGRSIGCAPAGMAKAILRAAASKFRNGFGVKVSPLFVFGCY